MTLRSKLLALFFLSSVIFCGVYVGVFIVMSQLSQDRLFAAVLTGQTSTWTKVRDAAFERMSFFAYDASPGQPSIWRLRGRRSPINAVRSGNRKKMERAIGPLYERLKGRNVLDALWIFDHEDSIAYVEPRLRASGTPAIGTAPPRDSALEKLSRRTRQDKTRKTEITYINNELYATVAFPIFANARVIGTVIYAKRLESLIDDLAKNTNSEVFVIHSVGGMALGKDSQRAQLIEPRPVESAYSLLESGQNVYLSNLLTVPLSDSSMDLIFLLDVTAKHQQQRRYYLSALGFIVSLTAVLIVLANALLSRGFHPLERMIAVLNALSAGDTSVDVQTRGNDEVGRLATTVSSFRQSLIEKDRALAHNVELQRDNLRMGAELEVTQRLQEMVLPSAAELGSVEGLDIAAHMEPAEEVGGDYYDVLQSGGRIKIGIGDVTGHGLESGVMMLMAQTAVRTLFTHEERLPKKFFKSLNQTLFDNMQRMHSDKNLTLSLIDYCDGEVLLSGQHEEVIVVKADCSYQVLDTIDLGFPIALEPDIEEFVNEHRFTLAEGDGFVLFTDGITEAENKDGQQFGMERLCSLLGKHWSQSAEVIKDSVLAELKLFIGAHVVHDDITLVIVKRDTAPC